MKKILVAGAALLIAAGAVGMRLSVFMSISVLGRTKRFFLEALLIYWYGPQAVEWLRQYGDEMLWGSVALTVLAVAGWYARRRWRRRRALEVRNAE